MSPATTTYVNYTPKRIANDGGNVTRGRACAYCKDKKLKCDSSEREGPCTNCTKRQLNCVPA